MFRIVLMLLTLSPCSAFAILTLEVEYAFTAPEESVVESYKLYMDGAIVCTTTDISDDRFECDIEVPAGVSFLHCQQYLQMIRNHHSHQRTDGIHTRRCFYV